MAFWQCTVCKYIHEGDAPPEKCPICGVPASKFVEIDAQEAERQAELKKARKAAKKTVSTPGEAMDKKPDAGQPSGDEDQPRTLFQKISGLMVHHHAHPVSVHIPNGVLPVVVAVFFLSWIFDSPLLAKVGMINLIFVVAALPFVIFSGVIEWKVTYRQAMTPVFMLKIGAAAVTAGCCVINLIWILAVPGIMDTPQSWAFMLINVIMIASAGVAGHIGGKLVFKD